MLILASGTSILSTDLYAPSLPHLPKIFATDAETVTLTMSLNLTGFAIAQLVYGPLADRFGRRPVLVWGMIGFGLFSLACAAAQDIAFLIAARALQGLAAAAEAVVVLTVIRDLYDERDSVRILGIYGMTVALAPAVGPIIGGYVHVYLGWRANFLLLAALIAVAGLLIVRHLPETGESHGHARGFGRIISGYAGILCSRPFITGAIACAGSLAGLFAFITAGPFVLIDLKGVATQHYGFYQAAIVAAYVAGSGFASRSARRLGLKRVLTVGLAIQAVGGVALAVTQVLGRDTAFAIAGDMCVFAFGLALVFATAPVLALGSDSRNRGMAAALLGAIEMGGGALGALAVGFLEDGTARPMAFTVAACGAMAAVSGLMSRTGRRRTE